MRLRCCFRQEILSDVVVEPEDADLSPWGYSDKARINLNGFDV